MLAADDIVATIYGVDPQYIPDLNLVLTAGDYNNGNSGCLVGSTFAKDHNIKVGSRISIGSDGEKGTLRVTGIIEERGMSFDLSTDNAIVATQDWFDNTYNRNDYDQIIVKVKEGQDTADVKTTIEKQTEQAGQDRQRDGQQGNAGHYLFDIWHGHDLCHCNRRDLHGRCRVSRSSIS